MVDYKKLKYFFHTLNSCQSIEAVETLIFEFTNKKVSLRIFDDSIAETVTNTEYLNKLKIALPTLKVR